MNPKKLIGALVKIVVAAVVMVYLGLHTLNFFMYTFPPEQWYLSWLGFGLTGGGLIGYLIVFLWDADTHLKKVVALIMTLVCGIGEVLAAGFGMQIESWSKAGFTLAQSDFDMMLLAVRGLAFAHFLALIVYIAGDQIGAMFKDDDGDGIINLLDPVDNRKVLAADTKREDVRQPEPIKKIAVPEDVYKQLLSDAGIGQGISSNGNGHSVDPTKAARS